MGRPPSNGGPSFRFNPNEVVEMEGILQAHNCLVPQREILVALAEKFSNSAERSGRPPVQMKQVWNWFQNRRYALRAKSAKPPVKLNVSPMPQHDSATPRNVSQAPQYPSVPAANVRNAPQVPQPVPTPTVQSVGRNGTDNSQMEFEAKSARDGAWYDVATFLSHRSLETNDPEVLVRFAGFGPEEDEWVNVRKHVRQRSLPCESSECVTVLPGDLILCFQEGKEQALYFDAHVLDAQKRRHDVRGCRCRFLVRYDHDQSEEIVPLRKVCRRPETDYRMQQLHADSADIKSNKTDPEPHNGNNVKAYPPAEVTLKQPKDNGPAETIPKPPNPERPVDSGPDRVPVSNANISVTSSVTPIAYSSEPSTTTASPHSNISVASTLAPDPNSRVPGMTILPSVASSVPAMPTAVAITNSSELGASIAAPVTPSVPVASTVVPVANSSDPGATIVAPSASNVHAAAAVAPVADSSASMVPTTNPVANSSVPMAPTAVVAANSCIPEATVADSIASKTHITPAATPVANSSTPIVSTTISAGDASVPISEAPAPTANSSAPIVSISNPAADASVSISESPVPAVNTISPIASPARPNADPNVLGSEATAPVAHFSLYIDQNMVPSVNSSASVAPTVAPDTSTSVSMACIVNSSFEVAPAAQNMATTANSSAPVAQTVVLDTSISVPTAPTVDSSIEVAPAANSSHPTSSSAEAPVANSSVTVAMIPEAPATNSSGPEATTEDPVSPDVPSLAAYTVSLEKVSESGSANNVDNSNAQSSNPSRASDNDTNAVSEEGPGESTQLG